MAGFFDQFAEDQSPAPQAAPAKAQEKPQTGGGNFFDQFSGDTSPEANSGLGSSPFEAIQDSPLGIIDRARLGWAKTPKAQQTMLEELYGKGNVELVTEGDEAGFSVKEKDGNWYSVNPAFKWDLKSLGDLPGDVAEFAGSSGLKSAAAAKGGIAGAKIGATIGATAGPYGAAGLGFVGALVGAGAAATGEDVLETAGRYALSKIGQSRPESLPQNPEELKDQLTASFMFGAEQELGGKVLHGIGRGSVKALAKVTESMSATPQGKYVASKLIATIAGQPESMARVRVENPRAMIPFDALAHADAVNNTNRLGNLMRRTVERTSELLTKRKAILGQGYTEVASVAGKLDYKPTAVAQGLLSELTSQGYLKGSRAVTAGKSAGIELALKPTERKTINLLSGQASLINRRISAGKGVTYTELQNFISNIDNALYESEAIVDKNLRRILSEARAGAKNHLLDVLGKADKAARTKLEVLDSKWGPIKQLMGDLATKERGAKLDTFIKHIVKNDGSYNSELLGNLKEFLGGPDATEKLLRMHAAQNSTKLWSGKKVLGVIPMGTPKGAAALTTGFSQAKGVVTESSKAAAKMVPYLDKANQTLKALNPADRLKALATPAVVDNFFRGVAGAAAAEDQATEELLKQAGVQ